jgi:hypothetical protein
MYNFQKLSETTSLRCNNSSENSVPKSYRIGVFHVATGSYPIQWKHSLNLTSFERKFENPVQTPRKPNCPQDLSNLHGNET